MLSLYQQTACTPKLRPHLKSLLYRCVQCHKVQEKTIGWPRSTTSPARLSDVERTFQLCKSRPCWPFLLHQKLYICLFIYAVTRAVHLGVVSNLIVALFLQCLSYIAATHGEPCLIFSDNYKTFISSEEFMQGLQQKQEVIDYLKTHHIQWKIQTPRPPWMGSCIMEDPDSQITMDGRSFRNLSGQLWLALQQQYLVRCSRLRD